MKVLILGNQARSMSVFWRVLIGVMREKGMEVVCCVPPGDTRSEAALAEMGAKVINFPLDRKGLNPIRDARSLLALRRVFREERPDMIFCATIKPVIYGCLAARMENMSGIFATITGLGYTFEADTPLKKIINRISRFLYKISLRHARAIFFQNHDDAALFEECGILSPHANVLFAAGTGVDTRRFAPAPFPPLDGPIIFLLVGRLLEAKGIREYAEAAASLKSKYPLARFQLLGAPETGLGSIAPSAIESWTGLEYLGQTRDVRPFLANAHVAVLPSWREGVPTALLEAMSMGRPCVATDVPGCREVVRNNFNGCLVPPRDPAALARAMETFLLNPESVISMGRNSRALVLEKFEAEKVAEGILSDMLRLRYPDSN